MSADIYTLHDRAFSQVAAYVVLDKGGDRVATIAFKFPKDGAGRLYAYVHWLGTAMVRGFAGGCGYDKRSSACRAAAEKLRGNLPGPASDGAITPERVFVFALLKSDGRGWDHALSQAGFTVLQAV